MQSNSGSNRGGAEANRTSSFRVYYGGSSGSIPFKWESAPGTPIHALNSTTATSSSAVPPLAPPPSFRFADDSNANSWPKSKFRPSLVVRILKKLKKSVSHVSPLHSSTSSSSSLQSGVRKTDSFRFGRLQGSGSGYSRPASDDKDHVLSRTSSFEGEDSVTTLRFEHKRKHFRGCFGS